MADLVSRIHLLQQVERLEKDENVKANIDALDKALILCDLIDILAEDYEHGIRFVRIDKDTRSVLVVIDLDCPIFENGRSHPFFQYIKMADRMFLEPAPNEMSRFKFIVKELYTIE